MCIFIYTCIYIYTYINSYIFLCWAHGGSGRGFSSNRRYKHCRNRVLFFHSLVFVFPAIFVRSFFQPFWFFAFFPFFLDFFSFTSLFVSFFLCFLLYAFFSSLPSSLHSSAVFLQKPSQASPWYSSAPSQQFHYSVSGWFIGYPPKIVWVVFILENNWNQTLSLFENLSTMRKWC